MKSKTGDKVVYRTSHLRIHQVFFDFARIFSFFALVFRTSNFWSLKGELKAEISNFSNTFFAKSNKSEVNFVKLFSLVYCFLRENYVRSSIFPAFATSLSWAQKLNQQPAVTYDMGKDGEERFRNQEKKGKHKWCTAIHHYG